MDYFQTKVNNNYVKFNPHYHIGAFTKYCCFRQNKVQAIHKWVAAKGGSSIFFHRCQLLFKACLLWHHRCGKLGATNKPWQYNKALNLTFLYAASLCIKKSN